MIAARPKRLLDAVSKKHPHAWKGVQFFLDRPPQAWPSWCFLPMAGFYAIARGGGAAIGVDEIWAVQELAALGTWRYTQGIYRIDPALIEHIAQTPIGGDLPCDALMHLPEWCMYIESPGQKFDGLDVHGFFAHLEYDVGTGRQELRLLLDSEDGLIGMPIHLGPWTLSEAVNRVAEEALKYGVFANL